MDVGVGDIVRVYDRYGYLYLVLEIQDFSDEEVKDVDYKLVQIYPQTVKPNYCIEGMDDVSVIAKIGTEPYSRKMNILKVWREEKGWDEPLYMSFVREAETKLEVKQKPKPKQNPLIKLDIINYSTLKTIDECLDAINDLDFLHKKFGDDEYLKSKKVVHKRLTKLIR